MDLQKLRFGFEYETLVEPDASYDRLLEVVVEKSKENRFAGVCNDALRFHEVATKDEIAEMVAEAQRTRDPLLEKMAKAAKLEDPKAGMVHLMSRIHLFLMAAAFNAITDRKTRFRVYHHEFGKEACDTFRVNIETREVSGREASGSKPSEVKTWVVMKDASVLESGFPLYETFDEQDHGIEEGPVAKLIPMIEIVSPVLTYRDVHGPYFADILERVLPLHGHLRMWNNDKTSNHVHFSYAHGSEAFDKNDFLFKFCMTWLVVEPIWFVLMGHWRRNNRYCLPMNERLCKELAEKGPVLYHQTTVNDLFKLATGKNLRAEARGGGSKENFLTYALVNFFQGPIHVRDSRYAAVNMLNLKEGGIQTVEIRIKQGSASGEENRMYLLLLSNFVQSVMDEPVITEELRKDPDRCKVLWRLYDRVAKHWGGKTRVALPKDTKDALDMLADRFFGMIRDTKVRAYWRTRYEQHVEEGGTSVRSSGGGASRSSSRKDPEVVYTSFGVVDYEKMRRECSSDPAYQAFLRTMSGSPATHRTYIPEPTRATAIAAHGGKK